MTMAEDERLSESIGVSLRQRRLEVFVLGSVLAAVGGTVLASAQGLVTPDVLNESTQITLLLMLFVSGRKSVAGAILGAIVIEYLTTSTSFISTNIGIIEGTALLVILLVEPDAAGAVDRPWPHQWGVTPVVERSAARDTGAAKDTRPRGIEEVGTVRETPPEVTGTGSSAGSGPAPDAAAVLACYDVTTSYGGVVAVDSVSLEVPRQGLFGLCGFNGAGKSTLFNLLAGSVSADSGSVRIEGVDATGWPAMRRARPGVARDLADGPPSGPRPDGRRQCRRRLPARSRAVGARRAVAAPGGARAGAGLGRPGETRHRPPSGHGRSTG